MDWQMELNPKKCEFLRITKKKRIIQSTYYIGSYPMLAYRRDKARIIFLYKIIHILVDITPPESYLRPNSRDARGHPLKFTQLPTNIDTYKHSFFPSVTKLWNNLSSD